MSRIRVPFVWQLILVCAAYVWTARLGLSLDAVGGYATLVWPPTGLALASLLLGGYRLWPAIFGGALLTNVLIGGSLPIALGIAIGNTLEAIAGAYFLQQFGRLDPALARRRDVMSFIFWGALLSPVISASIGVLSLLWGGVIQLNLLGITWRTWWWGDALGALTIATWIFAWQATWRDLRSSRLWEFLLLLLSTLASTVLLFGGLSGPFGIPNTILPYILFPFVTWASLRFGQIGSTTTVVGVAIIAVWGTAHGIGPFAGPSLLASLFLLQSFVATIAVTGLVLSASIAELQQAIRDRTRAEAALQRSHEELAKHAQTATEELRQESDERLEEIHRSREFLDSVIENLPNMVFVKDARELRFVRFNKAGEELLGRSRKTLIGKNDYDFFPVEQADHFTAKDRKVLATKELMDIPEEKIQTLHLGERVLHTRKIPILDKDGTPQFLLGISEDITEMKQAEEQKIRLHAEKMARAEAEAANRAKSLFLANMSHEIRTPLGAILGYASLLEDPELSVEERNKYLDVVNRNGRVLTQLIDDILDLSKVEAGHLDVETIGVSIPSLLADITTLLQRRAQEKGLGFTLDCHESVPETIFSDPIRLRQILINIIGNAIKFTEQGEIRISVRSGLDTKQPQQLIVTVDDTGPGILPEQEERLFTWFTQADASTTRKFGGTGLGLALSRRLARALGGDVILAKTSESGCRFTITIATNLDQREFTRAQERIPKPTFTPDISATFLAGVRVLLVDDSADNRALVVNLLSRRGASVEVAYNGREGVSKALSQSFDVVLMDIQMPILDGLQATSELRRKGFTAPIIALTAHAMKEERERTLAAGCNAHLIKPIDIASLLNTVAKFSSRPQQQS